MPEQTQVDGLSFLALSCVGFLVSAPAFAAEPGEPRLGRMTVTDTAIEGGYRVEALPSPKATAPLLDTPRTIAVLPAELIRQSGATTLADALRLVPGITLGAGEGGNPQGDRIFIRGFEAQGSTYVDGLRSVGGQSREIFAVEQVEVAKGSASAIGGRGNAGGAINLVTKQPHIGTDAQVDASLGTSAYKRATLDVNHQFAATAAIRLNAMWHDQDVAGRDAVNFHRWGLSPSVAFGLDTRTRATIGWYHLESDDLPDAGTPYARSNAQAIASGLLAIEPVDRIGGRAVPRTAFYGLTGRDFRRTNIDEALVRFEHDWSDTWTLTTVARYADVRQDYVVTQPDDSQGNVANGLVWRRANSRWSRAEAFDGLIGVRGRLETGPLSHSLAAGFEYAWEQARRGSYGSGAGNLPISTSPRCDAAGIALYNCTSLFAPDADDPWVNRIEGVGVPVVRGPITGRNTAETWAVYAFDTISLGQHWLLNVGGRYDDYRSRAQTWAAATGAPTDDARYSDGFFTWSAGITYKPAPEASLYLSYASSITPPGSTIGEGLEGNGIATLNQGLLRAEKTESYEAGVKWALLAQALTVSAAVFRTETSNARITNIFGEPEYAGNRRIDGAELAATGRPLPFWNLYAGYTYMDSELRSAGANATAATLAGVGRPFPNTPKHSFTSWTSFDIAERFQLGGGAIYNSRIYGGFAAGGVSRSVPGYWRFDLAASARLTSWMDLSLNIQNLTDKRYFDRAYASHFASMAPGRYGYATLTVKY
jgi:catecholate siderophore receptor